MLSKHLNYVGLIFLAIFYACVATVTLQPHVSQAYHDYYIERSSNLSIYEANKISEIPPNEMTPMQSDKIVTNGWLTRSGTYLSPKWTHPCIYIKIGKQDHIHRSESLTFYGTKEYGVPAELEVEINGHKADYREITGPEAWALEVDGTSLQAGVNQISFHVCNPHTTQTCDVNHSFALNHFYIRESSK